MSALSRVKAPAPDTLTASVEIDPPRVTLSGSITALNPAALLSGFFEGLHAAALADGLSKLEVNVAPLTFVNSSAIRLFIDWATRLKAVPADKRYALEFTTDRRVTWQRTSFSALKALAADVITVRSVS